MRGWRAHSIAVAPCDLTPDVCSSATTGCTRTAPYREHQPGGAVPCSGTSAREWWLTMVLWDCASKRRTCARADLGLSSSLPQLEDCGRSNRVESKLPTYLING